MTIQHLTVAGESVTIRPIQLTDAAREAEFVRALSPKTKHFRFFGGVRELSPAEIKRLCTVDGCHSMAFIATTRKNGQDIEIGVSRYAPDAHDDIREMAIAVADDWQSKGLDALLMQPLIAAAKENGVKQLYSIDLADNAAMQALAGKLGMRSSRDPNDPHQVIYSLSI